MEGSLKERELSLKAVTYGQEFWVFDEKKLDGRYKRLI